MLSVVYLAKNMALLVQTFLGEILFFKIRFGFSKTKKEKKKVSMATKFEGA